MTDFDDIEKLAEEITLTVIIPVYDEVQTIKDVVRAVHAVDLKKEIIIVDDGSSDGTVEALKEIAESGEFPEAQIFYHDRNRGKGAAIRTASRHITGDLVVIQDADLEYHPEDYIILMKPILKLGADAVYGSRFLGVHRSFLFWHYMGNKFLTLLTNLLYDTILTDMETCYKMFRAPVFTSFTIESDRFDFEPEITAKILRKGYKIYEVPITYSGRDFDEGKKITWVDGIAALWTLLKFRFKRI